MNQQELLQFAEKTFKECLDMMKQKNSDYTDSSKNGDAFRNFSLCEWYGVLPIEKGFWVRMSDKFSRLSQFMSSGNLQVKSESVEDTLKDLMNYSLLLMAYLHEKKQLETNNGWPGFEDPRCVPQGSIMKTNVESRAEERKIWREEASKEAITLKDIYPKPTTEELQAMVDKANKDIDNFNIVIGTEPPKPLFPYAPDVDWDNKGEK